MPDLPISQLLAVAAPSTGILSTLPQTSFQTPQLLMQKAHQIFLQPCVQARMDGLIAAHQKLIVVYGSIPADIDWVEPETLLANHEYGKFLRLAHDIEDPNYHRIVSGLNDGGKVTCEDDRRCLLETFQSSYRRITPRNDNGLVSSAVPMLRGLNSDQWRVIGFSKLPSHASEKTVNRVLSELDEVNITPVFISLQSDNIRRNVFGRGVLWPVMHGFTDLLPGKDIIESGLECFLSLGQCLAREIVCEAEKNRTDTGVWYHDYSTFGAMLAFQGASQEVGLERVRTAYFHHVCFPSPETLNALPSSVVAMISGALNSVDLLSFHTVADAGNALSLLGETQKSEIAGASLRSSGRAQIPSSHKPGMVTINVDPISIEPTVFNPTTAGIAVLSRASEVLQSEILDNPQLSGKRLLYYVGRADYTKGILEALEAYRNMLRTDTQREYLGETVFLVHSPSEASVLEKSAYFLKVLRLSALINAEFGDKGWQLLASRIDEAMSSPANFSEYPKLAGEFEMLASALRRSNEGWLPVSINPRGSIERGAMLAYTMASDVTMMPSIADGLGLVAKEWTAIKYLHGLLAHVLRDTRQDTTITEAQLLEALSPYLLQLYNQEPASDGFAMDGPRLDLLLKIMLQIISLEKAKSLSKGCYTLSPGALIIGKGAGASHEMSEAYIVDPTDGMAFENTIKTALRAVETDPDGIQSRWGHLYERVVRHQVLHWGGEQIRELFAYFPKNAVVHKNPS